MALDGALRRSTGTLAPGKTTSLVFGLKPCGPYTLAVDVDGEVPEMFNDNNAGAFYGVTMTPPPACTPEPTTGAVHVPYAER